MNKWADISPVYKQYQIPEFDENPLIAALNELPQNDKEILKRMMKKPTFSPDERELAAYLRRHLLVRLTRFMFPNKQHVKIMKGVYNQVFDGYVNRPNPVTPEGQRLLHGYQSAHSRPSTVSFLTSLSGQGKTTLIRTIMGLISPPLINHSKFNGESFIESQIVFLKRNVPEFCTVRALCKNLGTQADKLLKCDHHSRSFRDNSMKDLGYIEKLEHIITNYHLGAIVIDDFQNIDLVKEDRQKELIALITNLREELGVPIILVGTYKAANVLKRNASTARRLVDGGFYELERPTSCTDEDWKAFCKIIWRYQWVQKPETELSDDFTKALYDYSQGITGVALSLYINAQIHAIDSGLEYFDTTTLDEVYHDQLRPLHGVIEILKGTGDYSADAYDDLFFDAMPELQEDPVFGGMDRIKNDLKKMMGEISFSDDYQWDDSNQTTKKSEDKIDVPDLGLSKDDLLRLIGKQPESQKDDK